MDRFIFDILDEKLREYTESMGKSPKRLLMDPYTYLELKQALGYDEDDFGADVKTWNGFHVTVDVNEDETVLEFV